MTFLSQATSHGPLKRHTQGGATYRSEDTGIGRMEYGAKGMEVDISVGSDCDLTFTVGRTAPCYPDHPVGRGLTQLQLPEPAYRGAMLWASPWARRHRMGSSYYDILCQGHGAPAKVLEGGFCLPALRVRSSHLEVDEPGLKLSSTSNQSVLSNQPVFHL